MEVQRGMKAKTIKKIVRAKIDSWLSTIEDPSVKQLAEKNTIVQLMAKLKESDPEKVNTAYLIEIIDRLF